MNDNSLKKEKPRYITLPGKHVVQQVCAGRSHAVIRCDDGALFAFGDNRFGQCALPMEQSAVDSPSLIKSLIAAPITDVVCGDMHTAAITVSGCVYLWGHNQYGQLASGCSSLFVFLMCYRKHRVQSTTDNVGKR